MATPVFVQAGDGLEVTTGISTVSLANTTAGNLMTLHVLPNAGADFSATNFINVEDMTGTDNAMSTHGINADVGSPAVTGHYTWLGRSLGGTVSSSINVFTGSGALARFYEFSGLISGSTVSEGDGEVGGTNATISDLGITTTGPDRLATQFVAVLGSVALGDFTGETGGDWTEAVAEVTATFGATLQLQTASIASAGTINGGSYTMGGSDDWGIQGWGLIPPVVPPAADLRTVSSPLRW